MLEVVIVTLKGPKSHGKPDRNIRLEDCTFREDLEDRHVLPIETFSFLGDPIESESALEAIGDFYFALATKGEGLCECKV